MFSEFKTALQKQFLSMKDKNLYRVKIDKDLLWDTYLNSYPEGTNFVYIERREYDCSACRSFIKSIGDLVSIDSKYNLVSLWGIKIDVPEYQIVADALSKLVKSLPIDNIYLHRESSCGVDMNYQMVEGKSVSWDHFYIQLPPKLVCKDVGPSLSSRKSVYDVFKRGLLEITEDSLTTTLELISQGSLYRGSEHRKNIEDFLSVQTKFKKIKDDCKEAFIWEESINNPGFVTCIKNTVIGSLLMDLSEGKELEKSVASYESKVAPTNYKRPSALVTPRMIENAKKKVEELGLTSSLGRRFATISDVSINDILFTDRDKVLLSDNPFDTISATEGVKTISKVEEIPIEKFISEVLPRINSMSVLLENRHAPNLFSLIAPTDLTAKSMLKWGNSFSWAYKGDVTDSIKEKVKAAGGSVTGYLRISLSWFNYDDLDLHVIEPSNFEIFYGDECSLRGTGGTLDVDMNVVPETRTPVENIAYPSKSKMEHGVYKVIVHQFQKRESVNLGFDLEIEFDGNIYSFSYPKGVIGGIPVANIICDSSGLTLKEVIPSSQAVKTLWGVPTQTYHKVSTVLLSPNFWSEQVGNKHYFFMIDKMINDEPTRGFFNEFLSEELTPHRKVLELLGSKMLLPKSEKQVSGVGFSSTNRNNIIAKVSGNFNRTIKVTF